VDVNGSRSKAHREIHVGDRLSVGGRQNQRRELIVRALAGRSIPKAQARKLYEDVTPPVAPEVAEARRLDRLMAPKVDEGRPGRRERREIIRRKGR
jgi:ribosomal 50S subunit-recycling heat shock protein